MENIPKNIKCILFGDRDKNVAYLISKCCKQAQKKYKSKHDWVRNDDQLEIVQDIKIWLYWQIVFVVQ